MKSIFSTQNLQTFFLRKYWRLPRGRPPGPPGPPSRRPPPGPPSRRGGPLGAGACFCSSAIPATLSFFRPPTPGPIFYCWDRIQSDPQNLTSRKNLSGPLARRGRLLRSRCCRRRRRGPARTPRGALLALLRKLLLPLQILIQTDGLILDDHVLHAEAALQLSNQLAVRGANLLVHVNAFTVLVDAIGQLARAPLLGLLDLAASLLTSVLDQRQNRLAFLIRRCRTDDENQVVIPLFQDDLFSSQPFCVRGRNLVQRPER